MAKHKDNIIRVFEKFNRPMQAKEIWTALTKFEDEDVPDYMVIAVTLVRCVDHGMLVKVKYPKIATFYCKPEWVKDGKIKEELNFDPYWHKRIKIA